ncbi:hypothetical protein [Methylobacterium oryzihabitans]|uniref:Uncharacterized protein n=1 Tax=Methylobacterium oryzihabitans TaxID=2499852 RepID=A0A437P5K0_9HYPH|nr:hypothetical protein [Methylobacterium oryzihabitans]RVU17428.1 hypothetical protein EOE48_13635 [Methylobacterium oryzihabitans]
MRDLDRALADIVAIRSQIAGGTTFRGYGPVTLAATGGLALLTAGAQSLWLDPAAAPMTVLAGWVAAALLSAGLIGTDMLTRSRRLHSGLADAMIRNAVAQFVPAGTAGALLLVVLARGAPDCLWLLPGLWQVLVGLGIFAAARSLPGAVALAGAWYVVAGLAVLLLASETRALSPWAMGVPFAIGQVLVAVLIHRGGDDAEP